MHKHVAENSAPRVLGRTCKYIGALASDRDITISLDLVGREEHDGVSQANPREVAVVDRHDVSVFLVLEIAGRRIEDEVGSDGLAMEEGGVSIVVDVGVGVTLGCGRRIKLDFLAVGACAG